jgi:hypothetical protein
MNIAFLMSVFFCCAGLMLAAEARSKDAESKSPETAHTKAERTTGLSRDAVDAVNAEVAAWTNAVPNLKVWIHSRNFLSLVADEGSSTNYPAVFITGANGDKIEYTAKLTSVHAIGDHVQRVELQSPNMTIDETRTLGLQLCKVLGIDSKDFLSWCDKVGNRWLDQPVFASKNGISPVPSKTVGFTANATFNDRKPWFITFICTDK